MRRWYSVLPLALAACSPGAFDDFVNPASGAPEDASVRDASADPNRNGGLDAARSSELDAALPDGATVEPDTSLDRCGQLRPTPSQLGIADGGVVFAGTIAQSAQVLPRAPTDVLSVDGELWWLFGSTFQRGTLLVRPTGSITSAPAALPYDLRETAADAGVPTTLLPALDADLAMLAAGEQLSHDTGSLLATGPHDALLFYATVALSKGEGPLIVSRHLGTRVAHVHIENGQAHATPEPALVFGPERPAFRYGLIADGYVYLYGCRPTPYGTFDCTVARAPQDRATSGTSYEFRTADGWSTDFGAAAYVLDQARDELSVSFNRFLGRYLTVHMHGIASQILLRTSLEPGGPWEPLGAIELPPPEDDKMRWHYGALEHPELATQCERKLELTYMFAQGNDGSELRRIEVLLREGTR